MDLIKKAEDFCKLAHVMQKRKYTGEPYWHHCREVAFLVEAVGGTPEMIAAAWLHDTVEDTGTRLSLIENEFGLTVACYVDNLTDVSKPEDGNRAARRKLDREHTATISPNSKTVKLADLISNSSSITRHDPDFSVVYMEEKKLLLPHLTEGNSILHKMASEIVWRYYLHKEIKNEAAVHSKV